MYWTEDVLAELLHALRKSNPEWDGARVAAIRKRITQTFEVGRVEDFVIDGSYCGRDPHDAHVHAAAMECRAEVLLTCNVSDFVWDENDSPYEVMHPDDFLVLADDAAPRLVKEVTERMQDYWFSRRGESDLPKQLRKADCPQFAERVGRHLLRHL